MLEFLMQPWPWYVGGPLIGLIIPALLLLGGRMFGISDNLRHVCAAVLPGRVEFFNYDWRRLGSWNLVFALGIIIGGFIAAAFLGNGMPIALSDATLADLADLGITDFSGLAPSDVFGWAMFLTPVGFVSIVVGGFLVGFGTRYAGGCTSGHAISGLSDLQLPSLLAVVFFFVGGLITTHLVLPLLLAVS